MSYFDNAKDDACDTITNFRDEIIEQLISDGEASDDLLNNYSNGDSYHHENHTDKSYTLLEAAELLEDLDEYEETDKGLWEGLEPREAIKAQAAYTYANAVYDQWRELIEEINDRTDDVFDEVKERLMIDAKRDLAKAQTTPDNVVEFSDIEDDDAENEIDEKLWKFEKKKALEAMIEEVVA